ncbi:hypothetical protein TNCT_478601 [Trichonephila clavata]|uniref:Uncharacterized protein n=1 Tax=Trichonephila clavata TaxID=2740835 RepID=A0A8X6FFT9_TRICU|nr:hypothetical protein TNCT_478601 [Trichonephila clavata]
MEIQEMKFVSMCAQFTLCCCALDSTRADPQRTPEFMTSLLSSLRNRWPSVQGGQHCSCPVMGLSLDITKDSPCPSESGSKL